MAGAKVMTWWDPACPQAVEAVKTAGKGSPEIIMKKLGIGYCRADFLLRILQRNGIVGSSRNRQGTYQLLKKQETA